MSESTDDTPATTRIGVPAGKSPLDNGLTLQSPRAPANPAALYDTGWWVNWVRAYPLVEDEDTGEWSIDFDAVATKQPAAPYLNGTAKPVPWRAGLPDEEHPATDADTVNTWLGLRLGYDLEDVDRVISDTLRPGVILPVDREAENPDGITIIDWDDVRDPKTGETHPVALEAIRELGGYAAISQSGEGLHQWVYGDIPDGSRKFIRHIDDEPFVPGSDDLPQVEIYTSGRLVAMTGQHVEGTDDDIAEGQDLIDRLCWEFGTGTNNAPGIPTDPYGRRSETASAARETTPSHEEVGEAMREAVAYDGPDPREWDIPDDDPRSLDYHAVLRAREHSDELTSTANWELIGYAAAIGYADGLSKEEILADLKAHPTPRHGYRPQKAEKEVRSAYRKAKNDNFAPPSRETLVRRGILPERYADDPRERTSENDGEFVALLPDLPEDDRPAPTPTEFGDLAADVREVEDDEEETDNGAPSIDDLHARVVAEMRRIMQQTGLNAQAVADAIMGSGKTYGAFLAAHVELSNGRGGNGVLYVSGRKDLYEQAKDYALDVGFNEDQIYVLPSPDECPTFNKEHGKVWSERVWKLYRRGAYASTLHKLMDLPCCDDVGVGRGAECPYEARNKFDPQDYDVIIGHYKHAHIDHLSIGRQVIVDENPTDAFMTEVDGKELKQGINAFLSLDDSPAADGFDDLLTARHDEERRAEALQWFETGNGGEGFDFEPDERNTVRFEDRGYHAYAPHAVYIILSAEPVGGAWDYDDPDLDPTDYENGKKYPFEKAQLPGIGNEALFYTTSDKLRRTGGEGGDDYYVEIQTPPAIDDASSIIALDGTPLIDDWSEHAATREDGERVAEWEIALGRPLKRQRILSDDERCAFLAETMGHTYVQTTEDVRYYSSGKWNVPQRDEALVGDGSDQYLGGDPWDVLITSKKVADEYGERGFADPDADRTLVKNIDHRGNVRGSDEYAECASGVVLGAAHHGDHEVARQAAWLGEQIHPRGKGMDRTYGPAGDAAVRQMRELDTAQTALRIGRGKDGRGALVLIDTCAYPNWLPVVNPDEPAEVIPWGKTERLISNVFASAESSKLRPAEIAEALAEQDSGRSDRQLRTLLCRHEERGLVERQTDPDDRRRTVWVDTGVSELGTGDTARVEFPELDEHVTELGTGSSPYENTICETSDNQYVDTFLDINDLLADGSGASTPGPLALSAPELREQIPLTSDLDPPT